MVFKLKYFDIFLESNSFYTQIQIGSGSFEIIASQQLLISGSIYTDEKDHLISPELPAVYNNYIENDWISDNEIYGIFSENNINFSNSYYTIQKILIYEKGTSLEFYFVEKLKFLTITKLALQYCL